MNKKLNSIISTIAFLLIAVMIIVSVPVSNVYAANPDDDPMIVVSLGDSYSSGESIEDFYGNSKPLSEKVIDSDWLAHRSMNGWPALLKVPNYGADVGATMRDFKYDQDITEGNPYPLMYNCKWYFAASSGAEAYHISGVSSWNDKNGRNGVQEKTVRQKGIYNNKKHTEYLQKQISIFDKIDGDVDYVTLTIGGNDVQFADIITECAVGSTYLLYGGLEFRIKVLWNDFYYTRYDIKKAYESIAAAAPNADIIVAGYPQLLEPTGKGLVISKKEAELVDTNVTKFNNEIKSLVEECKNEGMKIHFVDVEEAFKTHEAFSSDPWINEILLKPQSQDIDYKNVPSPYSMHPNATGAKKGYAKCVNDKIAEIENDKTNVGYIKGKICKASDRSTPIGGATVTVYDKDNKVLGTSVADANGNYTVWVHSGEVRVEINAPGYIGFSAYTEVLTGSETYMETFLMVEGDENETGIAKGVINNALTGSGVPDVNLTVRRGWGNSSIGDVVTTTTTDSNGNYSVSLPLGNYTLVAEKEGYISGTVNIIVQSGTTGSQNGTITPILSGDNYRIVLTWGENPRDLDSHVVGTLTSGDTFHVYYSHKSQYDGSVEVCNLDVDDTTSYGPETITLNATTDKPYYYYIYRYAGSGTVASSEAKIKVYQGSNLVATFNVPTDQGSGDYWNVFAVVNGELIINNTITSSANVSYANVATRARTLMSSGLEDEVLNTKPKKETSTDTTEAETEAETEATTEAAVEATTTESVGE